MKALLSLVLLVACNNYNDAGRILELEVALKECRAQMERDNITVDPRQSWEGVRNEFDYVDYYITDEHFPPEPGVTYQPVIVSLRLHHDGEESISTEEALKRLEAQCTRPATAREARAFAKANPGLQREFAIVALGSSWRAPNGRRGVPLLHDRNYFDVQCCGRVLDLLWVDAFWGSRWRFLAVRE